MNIFNLGRKCTELRAEIDALKAEHAEQKRQFLELEKSFLDMNRSFSADLKDISERLDMPQRRKPTMRPWSMMRSVAEAGEQFMAIKSKPSA